MRSEEGVCSGYDTEVGCITLGLGGEAEELGAHHVSRWRGIVRGAAVWRVCGEAARQEAGETVYARDLFSPCLPPSNPPSLRVY